MIDVVTASKPKHVNSLNAHALIRAVRRYSAAVPIVDVKFKVSLPLCWSLDRELEVTVDALLFVIVLNRNTSCSAAVFFDKVQVLNDYLLATTALGPVVLNHTCCYYGNCGYRRINQT